MGKFYCPFMSVSLSHGPKSVAMLDVGLASGIEIPYYFNKPSDSYMAP